MVSIADMLDCPDFVDWSDPVDWAHPLNRGLVSWWLAVPNRMGWGSFTWRDLCRRNDGTLTGMTTSTDWSGEYLSFDGASKQVVIADNASMNITTPWTWFAKVYLSSATSGLDALFDAQSTDTTGDWRISKAATGGKLVLTEVNRADHVSASAIPTNQICTLGITVLETAVSLYINGQLDASRTLSVGLNNPAGQKLIGDISNSGTFGWLGRIYETRFQSVALGELQMRALHSQSMLRHPNLLNRIPLMYGQAQAAAGGSILPLFNHYQCAAQA